jgi:hypothetical protein
VILFNRVGEAFRRIEGREWALLALETAGVVAGILIAFELNEWAARRSAAARHREVMERLFEESEQDVATTRNLRDVLRRLVHAEGEFANALGKGECPPEARWEAVETVSMLPAFNAPRSVYQELMGAGGLSSIEDPQVRTSIARFNMALDWSQKQTDYFRGAHHQPVSDDDRRYHLRYDPDADEPQVSTFDRAALCKDPAFTNRMVAATRSHAVIAGYHGDVTEEAIRMCAILGDSLGRQCEPAFGGAFAAPDAELVRKAIGNFRNAGKRD